MACCLIATSQSLRAEDWPNFRGPNYDGASTETGFIKTWPEEGPLILWQREVGPAFSSFAISAGRLFTCGAENKRQTLLCLDVFTGEVIWKKAFEDEVTDPSEHLYGTRATPTVDGDRVYIMGGHGLVACYDVRTGDDVWQRRFANPPHWKYSGSVLIQGNLAVVAAGRSDGSLCALDKMTGAVVWTCGDDPAGYATPYPFLFDGRRYIVGFMAHSVIVADAASGALVLRVPYPSHSGVNASTPIFHDGHLFISTGYRIGSVLFKLKPDGDRLAAEEVWNTRKIRNKFQTPVLFDGNLYTSDENGLKCVDFMTGRVHWRNGRVKHGTLILADGHLILLTQKGELRLAPASPEGFATEAKLKLFEGTGFTAIQQLTRQKQGRRCWTVPVLSGGRLYVRDHDTLMCLDLRGLPTSRPAGCHAEPRLRWSFP